MKKQNSIPLVILASSLGSLVEWYDFCTFASLNTIISYTFFSVNNPYFAVLSTTLLYAVGYIFRPLGSIVFGYIGDKIGRRASLLFTMSFMGISTFLIGCIPSYHAIGIIAPIMMLILRICQGISLGGEYNNAAIYIAEYVPYKFWGRYTSSVQITPSLGVLFSVCIIATLKFVLSPDSFLLWGWRIAFWFSAFLILFSLSIRLKLMETPLYTKLKEKKECAENPLKESFQAHNIKWLLLSFSISVATGIISNGATIYSLFFIENTLHINIETASWLFAIVLAITLPLYYLLGWYHDYYGSKWLFIVSIIAFSLSVRGVYSKMYHLVDTNNKKEFVLQSTVTKASQKNDKHDTIDVYTITNTYQNKMKEVIQKQYHQSNMIGQENKTIFLSDHQKIILTWYLLYFVVISVAVNATVAPFIMSLFPTKLRSSSFGISYIGATVLGGIVVPIATYFVQREQQLNKMALVQHQPIPYPEYFTAGLLYPIVGGIVCAIIYILFLPNKKTLDKRMGE
ncbi:MAG: MFS transporter [Phycisphaerales bacterium]|nr:MFS transporter [Phycisphaerales bacterium]